MWCSLRIGSDELAQAERALGTASAAVSAAVAEARAAWASALARCSALRGRMIDGRDALERLRWEAAEVAEEVLEENDEHRDAVSADLERIVEEARTVDTAVIRCRPAMVQNRLPQRATV